MEVKVSKVKELNNGSYFIEFHKPIEIGIDMHIDKETEETYYEAYIVDAPFINGYDWTEDGAIDDLTTSLFGDIIFFLHKEKDQLHILAQKKKEFLQENIKTYKELSKVKG